MPSEPTPRHLALKAAMMPRDTNPYGTIFGGVLLSYIDQAGAVGAAHEISCLGFRRKNLVTVAMNRVEFHQPVWVGDIVSFWSSVIRFGKTSVTVQVDVEANRDGQETKLTEAEVTYVAVELISGQRHPIPIRDA